MVMGFCACASARVRLPLESQTVAPRARPITVAQLSSLAPGSRAGGWLVPGGWLVGGPRRARTPPRAPSETGRLHPMSSSAVAMSSASARPGVLARRGARVAPRASAARRDRRVARPRGAAPGRLLVARPSSRASRALVAAFGGFGKKPAPPPADDDDDAFDASSGNPFASSGGASADAADDDAPAAPAMPSNPFAGLKLPSLSGTFDAADAGAADADDEDADETDDAPAGGNPFASFGGFGTVGRTIDQTVDLDYDLDEDDSSDPAPPNPLGGFPSGLAGAAAAKKPSAPEPPRRSPSPPEQKQQKRLGNWERTLKEGVKEGDVPRWTLDPEPVRGARLQKFVLESGDVKVLGRDKPGIDVVAKVGASAGCTASWRWRETSCTSRTWGAPTGRTWTGRRCEKHATGSSTGASCASARRTSTGNRTCHQVDLSGAKEMDRNSEYGQVQAIVEALGGPRWSSTSSSSTSRFRWDSTSSCSCKPTDETRRIVLSSGSRESRGHRRAKESVSRGHRASERRARAEVRRRAKERREPRSPRAKESLERQLLYKGKTEKTRDAQRRVFIIFSSPPPRSSLTRRRAPAPASPWGSPSSPPPRPTRAPRALPRFSPPPLVPRRDVLVLPPAVPRANQRDGEEHRRVREHEREHLPREPREELEEANRRRNLLENHLAPRAPRRLDDVPAGPPRGVRRLLRLLRDAPSLLRDRRRVGSRPLRAFQNLGRALAEVGVARGDDDVPASLANEPPARRPIVRRARTPRARRGALKSIPPTALNSKTIARFAAPSATTIGAFSPPSHSGRGFS